VRIVSTKTHGILDYLTGATLLAAPKALGIEDEPSAARVLRMAGAGATAYSLLTDYELGLVRVLPMPLHLALDAASACCSPPRPGSSASPTRAHATGCRTRSSGQPKYSPP